MDIGRVLARSLEITWRQKVLWILGFVMAITGGGTSNGLNYQFSRNDLSRFPSNFGRGDLQFQPGLVFMVLAIVACLFLLALVLVLYIRFVARGALVSFVQSVEAGGAPTLGTAWREGRRYYWRLLGLGFLFFSVFLALYLLAFLAASLPFLGGILALVNRAGSGQFSSPDSAPLIAGALGFVVILCGAILCVFLLYLVVHPIYEFGVRSIVLENSGLVEGLGRGYRRLTANLGTVGLLFILLIGARIGWFLVTAIVALPFGLVLLGIGPIAASALPVWAILLILLAIGLPAALILAGLEGLFQVFEANTWTECYLTLLSPPASPPTLERISAPSTG